MNFDLSLGAGLDTPSFFEVAAHERVVPTLYAAFEHAITVMASRHPRLLLRVHKYRDEAFYLFMMLVERQCLHTCQASMAEHLFSLIRTDAAGAGDKEMTPRQRLLSLLLLTFFPYLMRKMERLCTQHQRDDDDEQQQQQAAAAGGPDGRGGFEFPVEARQWARMAGSVPGGGALQTDRANAASLGLGQLQVKQVMYLFGKTKFCSPRLWLLQVELRRTTGGDAQKLQQLLEKVRGDQMAWAASHRTPLRQLLRLIFGFWHFVNDNTKIVVLGLACLVKLADWYYSTEDMTQKIQASGVPLHPSRLICALCGRTRTNPAADSSGYVYCYPCLFKHVEAHGTCPGTQLPCNTSQIRRLYES